MRVWKDGVVARKPVQHFPMSVVRLKTLFWEIERRKTRPSGHLTQPETGATLIYATSAIESTDVSLTGASLRPSWCPGKGLSVCLTSHAHPRPRPKPSVCS
ncbi:hypothetical protein TNIN_249451 [Trichonephila inaurata madagascariensis]|uniref:Uncharacterized protein n=1 Tax=Trichonephila inaurata madagascariensis TaxID=2747483 RepID=A0A8X6XIA2_9ARAC|nr:hypothetical protein TNIN_249451 [Trichonephila inaurata madagascariensis]